MFHGPAADCTVSQVLLSWADWGSRWLLSISDFSGCDSSQNKSERLPEKCVPLSGCFLCSVFHTWKCLFSWIWSSKPHPHTHTHHTHNNCKHSRVWISHFLMSNISLGFHGNRRRGAAVSMPPPPSRRRDRRHPIMNTQITKTVSHPSSFRRLSLSSMSLPRAHHKVLVSARVFLSPLSCVGPNQVNLKLEPLLTADCSV